MTLTPTIEAARGRWRGILPIFGVPAKHLDGKHHPCPLCGGKDRWRFIDTGGNGTYVCNQCGGGTGLQLVQKLKGWDFKTAAREIDKIVANVPVTPQRSPVAEKDVKDWLNKLWGESAPITAADPAGIWLAHRCGVTSPPSCLRFHPEATYKFDDGSKRTLPAMIAKIVAPDGSPTSLHRTFLRPDGLAKADVPEPRRLMPREIAKGSAVRLMPHGDELGIGEGIESSFAASALFRVPVWAALNAVLMELWQPPADVRRIHIFGDSDSNFRGQAAAYRLANRLASQRDAPEVWVHLPEGIDRDWRDIEAERHAAQTKRAA
jgi:putative DNA primase/helicase